jgi:hypothetical protein
MKDDKCMLHASEHKHSTSLIDIHLYTAHAHGYTKGKEAVKVNKALEMSSAANLIRNNPHTPTSGCTFFTKGMRCIRENMVYWYDITIMDY